MKYARIEHNIVCEFIDFDPAGRFHPDLIFVECTDEVDIGDLYDTDTELFMTPEPAKPVLTCTPWQFRKALNQTGLRDTVEAAILAADQTTKDGWEFATEIRSDDPLVISMASFLRKPDDQMDALFTLARSL